MKRLLLMLALLAGAPLLKADSAQGQALLRQAQGYQAARQWTPAVQAYQAALKADPSLVQAYHGLGTVYYLAGKKDWSLPYFERYLVARPGDAATRKFVEGLRASLAAAPRPAPTPLLTTAPTPAPAAAPAAVESPQAPTGAGGFSRSFGARFGLLGLAASAADLNQWTKPYPGVSFGDSLAPAGELEGQFGFDNGFACGLTLLFGPSRSHALGGEGATGTASISHYGLALSPAYRIQLLPMAWLEARLPLGFLMAAVSLPYVAPPNTLPPGSTTPPPITGGGAGYLLWPQISYHQMLGARWGAYAGLGYLLSNVTPRDGGGQPLHLPSDNSSWAVGTGGPSFQVGLTYYLQSPLR